MELPKQFKIRIENPQQSEKVQKILFSKGYHWSAGKKIQYLHAKCIYGDQGKSLGYDENFGEQTFNVYQEITPEAIFSTKINWEEVLK